MPQFLVAIHHPDGYDGSTEGPEMRQAIDDLNDAMVEAGVRVFVGGLHPAGSARSVSVSGEVREGAYLPGLEHVGGLWVLEVADMDAAVEWGRRAAAACRAPVEVREFY